VVRVYGCELTETNARLLIRLLTESGTPAAVAAAEMISDGLSRQDSAGKLTPEMRDAILSVLTKPRNGLDVLQRALLKDQRARE
jgi:hypothetical protein